jgi:integrase/recombinase XerD
MERDITVIMSTGSPPRTEPSMPAQALSPRAASLVPAATSARNDQELLASWIASLSSANSRANFATTGERFLEALGCPLRQATVEDVRAALASINVGLAVSSARQYTLRVKSLLSYAQKLGYTTFNAGVVINPPKEVRGLSKRIISELAVADLTRSSRTERDYLIVAIFYGAGLRVSELVGLNCGDVIAQEKGRVQLHVVGKGGKEREILLPADLGPQVVAFCGGRPGDAPVFMSRKSNGRMSRQAVHGLTKRLAKRADVTERLSPHWLRHAHASHSLDRGAPLSVVAATLGHANVGTTSAYLHAKPDTASGDALDPGIWNTRRSTRDA